MKGITNASGSSAKPIPSSDIEDILIDVFTPVEYSIEGTYIGCESDNLINIIEEDEPYIAHISTFEFHTITEARILMGGVDISSTA